MYVLIKDCVPTGFALVAAAHVSLAACLQFKDTPEICEWIFGPFGKTVCEVNETKFEVAKMIVDNVIITESTSENMKVPIAFKPRQEWPKQLRRFALCS
jgi:hypothetical protein